MKKQLIFLFLAFGMVLSGCGMKMNKMDHMNMKTSPSNQAPKGMKAALNPVYKVGSPVTIQDDHMKGMKGAKGIIKGAYATTVYMVNYKPTTGGPEVKNHKWVVQEEIKSSGHTTLQPGTKVTLTADHMAGIKGAAATIVTGKRTTVYMVDYTPVTGGPIVKNHKWVTRDELSSAQ